jgi:hypothetical protein
MTATIAESAENARNSIIRLHDAITDVDCRCLIDIYKEHQHFSDQTDHSGHAVLYWPHLPRGDGARERLSRIVRGCVRKMADYELPTGPLYAETIILTALGPGGSHPRHADNCIRDELGNWQPNHTPHRHLPQSFI